MEQKLGTPSAADFTPPAAARVRSKLPHDPMILLGLGFQRPQFGDALLQSFVIDVGHAALDGVIKPLSPGFGFGSFLAEFGHVRGPPFGALLTAIEDNTQNLFQPGGIEQAHLQVLGDQIVQPLNRYRAAFASAANLKSRMLSVTIASSPPAIASSTR